MRKTVTPRILSIGLMAALVLVVSPFSARADHKWGNYHWARTSDTFKLLVGDNVDAKWDEYLLETAHPESLVGWSVSTVLDTEVVAGASNPKRCGATSGRIEVCNAKYGRNGWLGLASIWASGDHIVQATTKVNDTYFDTATYNTPGWRRLVMCQEVGHDFGLGHQDEDFNNKNLGTCMDYTGRPDGGTWTDGTVEPRNWYPNEHDYTLLEEIYGHTDSSTTVGALPANVANADLSTPADWGKLIRGKHGEGVSLYERDFGGGFRIFTFVTWAEPSHAEGRETAH